MKMEKGQNEGPSCPGEKTSAGTGAGTGCTPAAYATAAPATSASADADPIVASGRGGPVHAAEDGHPHFRKLRRRAAKLEREAISLGLALKDPSTPWLARVAIGAAFAYIASPIDLIPDFIPVLGQLDDLIIPPALLAFAIKLIPKETMARCRREAYMRRARARAAKEAKKKMEEEQAAGGKDRN